MLEFSKASEWKIIETDFDPSALGKVEANFCLGNGYLGLRSATEEKYLGETRDLLVAGTFNRFSPEEVTELPNAADVTNIEITLNGARFDLTQGTIREYSRGLNIQTGLLTREVVWTSPKGGNFRLKFERMVSLKRLHTIAVRISITPEGDTSVTFQSGIDGRVTCDGSQHFTEGETRFYDKKYLQFTPKTIQSNITFVIDATHHFYVDGAEVQPKSDINILRRRMFSKFTLDVKAGQTVVLEKFSNVYTSRDRELENYSHHQMQAYALKALQEDEKAGFDALLAESAACWKEKVWDRVPIEIDGPEFDQLAIRFAQYHMQLMTPAHDNRMNIGAKGLSGEGYKGHTFWDTEIFLLPYFIFNMPEVARSLEEYRYLSLPGAHAKAKHNGYEGAQFPWESAWLDDGEVTPEYMGTDIVTGKLIKVWSGFIEIHITADVAYGVWQYYQCTGDQDFMDKYGYELITFVIDATHKFYMDGAEVQPKSDINILRRRMFSKFTLDVKAGQTVVLEKFSNVFTSRDRELENYTYHQMQAYALKALQDDEKAGFDALLAESAACWKEKVWDRVPIEIDGPEFDQMAIRFAQYHMQLMTPAHDNRMNIGAKGLSGEGYKGHTFWDTEIFLLPYFIFNMPEVARSLEEYRYLSLPGAHAKARHNGYEGAQFPWESAWLDDGEVTPEYMGTDIVTGQLIKVWSGFIEIHITADVAYGVWQYYQCTGDQDFMDKYGYELMLDCARFWSSRLEPGEDGKLHINDVVGPDEYKEHVDDNAFTNYLVWWTIGKAIEYSEMLQKDKPELYAALDEKLGLGEPRKKWVEQKEKIFLTHPNENGVLPQDSTYLTLQDIDLSKYKKQAHVGGIYKDYNQEQITKIQVSKQADVMVLFLLLEELFPHQVKLSSWDYYEPRCLHDSSLSLSTHSVLACDIGDPELGYEMFRKACLIDLDNANPHSSDAGIHAASYGGLWQCVVWGFGGLRMLGGKLRISPNLPTAWKKLSYTLLWKGKRLSVTVTSKQVKIVNQTDSTPMTLKVWDKEGKLMAVIRGESNLPENILSEMAGEAKQKMAAESEKVSALSAEIEQSNSRTDEIRKDYRNILKWSEMFDSSDMAVKKMVAGYLIKKVCVYSNYRLHIEFNINFAQFELGLDIPNEYKAQDLA